MGDKRQLFLSQRLTPELRGWLDAYIAIENERIAPAKLPMNTVINEALREYLSARLPAELLDGQREGAAA